MNWFLLTAGILSALAAVVHAVAGERTDIRHLMASDVPMNEKIELRGVWHTFSIALGASALLAFYAVFLNQTAFVAELLSGLAVFYILCGLMVLGLIWGTQRSYLVKVPQWLLLILIGSLMWLGIAA